MRLNQFAAVCAALFCLGGTSFASVDFYGGDFDGRDALAVDFDAFVYDDFVINEVHQADLAFGNCLSDANFSVMTVNWEIRSGMSEGNGGTLVASGTAAPGVSATGRSGFGYAEYTLYIGLSGVALAAGEYYFGMNVGEDPFGGRTFVSTTSGANGVGQPLGNGNAWINSGLFGHTYTSAQNVLGAGVWDFSYGTDFDYVPEPATLVPLGVGLVVLAARRCRKGRPMVS